MKKRYEELSMEIIDIYDDVIRTSSEGAGGDPFNDNFGDSHEIDLKGGL